MTQKIGDDVVERCRRVPLHIIVGDHRINRQVKILCPFHAENTPSCNLFPTGGFKCYGCENTSANPNFGNSIDFLVRLGATYPEAIEELSKYI